MSFSAKYRIAMSGTSVENKLSELWSIMQFTNPVLLGSLTNYTKRFVLAIQNDGDVVLFCVALLGLVKLGWFRGFCVWYFWAVTGAFVYL